MKLTAQQKLDIVIIADRLIAQLELLKLCLTELDIQNWSDNNDKMQEKLQDEFPDVINIVA